MTVSKGGGDSILEGALSHQKEAAQRLLNSIFHGLSCFSDPFGYTRLENAVRGDDDRDHTLRDALSKDLKGLDKEFKSVHKAMVDAVNRLKKHLKSLDAFLEAYTNAGGSRY